MTAGELAEVLSEKPNAWVEIALPQTFRVQAVMLFENTDGSLDNDVFSLVLDLSQVL